MSLDALYASAPLLDDEDQEAPITEAEDILDAAGVMTLAPESFDAAVLDALIHP